MSALCLEVYYRFLPLYNDPGVAPVPATTERPAESLDR
jgi:hypothetical protein